MPTEIIGSYLIEFVTDTYVRVYRFGVVLFSGTPGAARAYCQS
jgi:hypothetical protein